VSQVSVINQAPIKPGSVIIAVRLLYVSVAIVFLRGIIVGFQTTKDVPLASIVLFMAVVSGIVCFLIYKISQARNWARIVYLLLFVTGNGFTILPLLRSVAVYPLAGLLGIGQTILELIGLVMLFLSSSNQWFKSSGESYRVNKF